MAAGTLDPGVASRRCGRWGRRTRASGVWRAVDRCRHLGEGDGVREDCLATAAPGESRAGGVRTIAHSTASSWPMIRHRRGEASPCSDVSPGRGRQWSGKRYFFVRDNNPGASRSTPRNPHVSHVSHVGPGSMSSGATRSILNTAKFPIILSRFVNLRAEIVPGHRPQCVRQTNFGCLDGRPMILDGSSRRGVGWWQFKRMDVNVRPNHQ
jgi:hypothetical protein